MWYEILFRVNNISKIWQKVNINLNIAIDNLCNFRDWIQEFRETGFNDCITKAYEFIEKSSYEIPTTFKEKRARRKKRMFSYEAADEPIDSADSKFRIDLFTQWLMPLYKILIRDLQHSLNTTIILDSCTK